MSEATDEKMSPPNGLPPSPSGDRDDTFYGINSATMDNKNRVMIPAENRKVLRHENYAKGSGPVEVFVTLGEVGRFTVVILYPGIELKRKLAELKERAKADRQAREELEEIHRQGEWVSLDEMGRVRLPEWVIQDGRLHHSLKIIGVHDRIEIWDASRHEDYREERKARRKSA